MFDFRNDLNILIFFYIIISLSIWYSKPKYMFRDNKMKTFGIGRDKSIISYPVAIIFLAAIMFYIFEIWMLKKTNLF